MSHIPFLRLNINLGYYKINSLHGKAQATSAAFNLGNVCIFIFSICIFNFADI